VSGLDELAKPRSDARADPAQFLNAAVRHQLSDRRLRLADRLRGPAIRA
jgi:hypothetical protein